MDIVGHLLMKMPGRFSGADLMARLERAAAALEPDSAGQSRESLAILLLSGRTDVSRNPDGTFGRVAWATKPAPAHTPAPLPAQEFREQAADPRPVLASPAGAAQHARSSALADLQVRMGEMLRTAVHETGEGSELARQLRSLVGLAKVASDGGA